jgi:tetratricopeptide (TPR) repeat protein
MLPSRLVAPCIVVAIALGAPLRADELPEALQAPFTEAVQALKAGRLDEAEALFRRVLDAGGKEAYVYNNLGLVYEQRGRHEAAAEQFREAIRRDAAYAAPRVALGASLLGVGKAKEAAAELEKAVELSPRDPLPRRELARAYERAGDWPGAVEQYRALRDLAPSEPENAYQLGKAYLRLSEWTLRALKDVDPPSARFYQAQGHTYRLQGQTDLAVRAFQRAAETDPRLPEVHLSLAQIYMEQKRWADARQEVARELAVVPESLGARLLRQRLQALEAKSP